ncbi:MAG TPA: hypothetical protein VIU37_04585 [Candidatus Limnocylindrales bacterium]
MALIVNPQETSEGAEDPATAPDVAAVVLGRPHVEEEPSPQQPAGAPEWGTADAEQGPADGEQESDSIVLFTLDGINYYVPRKPGPNVALAYLRDVRHHGEEYARAGLLERFIGEDGMDALADYEDLKDEDMAAIWQLVEKHVLGGVNRGNRQARRAPADRARPRTSPAGKRA